MKNDTSKKQLRGKHDAQKVIASNGSETLKVKSMKPDFLRFASVVVGCHHVISLLTHENFEKVKD